MRKRRDGQVVLEIFDERYRIIGARVDGDGLWINLRFAPLPLAASLGDDGSIIIKKKGK